MPSWRRLLCGGASQVNWARNVRYACDAFHAPKCIGDLQRLVKESTSVRAVGSRHSFSDCADTGGDLITLSSLPSEVKIDSSVRTVTVSSATTYATLAAALEQDGWALHAMASLPHLSVAGAVATATHGSGIGSANLTSAVEAVEYVAADGELRTARAGDRAMQAVVLASLGIMTKVTLRVQPSFLIRQDVYTGMGWAALEAHFESLMAEAYSVSVFTDWAPSGGAQQVWVKRRVSPRLAPLLPPPLRSLHGAALAVAAVHPVPGFDAAACTAQGGAPGPWCERLGHFRADAPPSGHGDELQSEYFVARECALAAVRAVRALHPLLAPVLRVSEIRTVAADELWLSPCFQRDSVALHFTWTHEQRKLTERVLPALEEALAPFGARPHWGKLFGLTAPEIGALYPRLVDYRALALELDPHGKFANPFVERMLGLSPRCR